MTEGDIHSLEPRGKVDNMVKSIVIILHIMFDIQLIGYYRLVGYVVYM